jgi:uncharacterized protein YdeI (YjbR/CyaY-like superfamily)
MGTRDKRIDAYIAGAADFAKPILTHLRAVVHEGCPEAEETLKWRMPTFMNGGKILCGVASFKAHCAFGFWQGALIVDGDKQKTAEAMGQFGRITSLKDLPPKRTLLRYVKAAVKLRDENAKVPRPARRAKKAVTVPVDLAAGLKKSAKATREWKAFPPSGQREYIEWIVEAKRPETRAERLKTTLQWVAEGKPRNGKYM